MKKISSFLLSLVLLILLLQPYGVYASESPDISISSADKILKCWAIAMPVDMSQADIIYTITPSSSGWKDLSSKQAMVNACRISDTKLSSMTTEEVVDAVLTFPLLGNIYAYDSFSTALVELAKDSDAYRELLKRENATEKLKEVLYSSTEINAESLQQITIRILLSDSKFILTTATSSSSAQTKIAAALTTLYTNTPHGTAVAIFYRGEEYTFAQKVAINEYYATTYPQATLIGLSTTVYNCHNYAWNTGSPSSYWMNNPSAYMTDGSYISTSVQYATKVYYGSSVNHSARMYLWQAPYIYPMVTAKWGPSPLMRSRANYGPYSVNSISYWKE